MVSRQDYGDAKVAKAREVLAAVFRALGEYREHILLVGGWVPPILLPSASEQHCGSLDVDIALDHTAIDEDCYKRISELLEELDFTVDPTNRHRFVRTFEVEGDEFKVYVDLLAPEYGGRGKKHEHQHVQDIEARKSRGCDLAFKHPVALKLDMVLPNGAKTVVSLQVAGVAAFVVMKAFALEGRQKSKDAYDIVYCLEQFPGGVEAVAKEFSQLGDHGLIREAMGFLADAFRSTLHEGPIAVADFRELAPGVERDVVVRRAFELVDELVRLVRGNLGT